QCVRDIRKALGHEAQDIVKTVPRRGYIFAVPVERTASSSVGAPAGRPVRPALAGLIALCLLLFGAAGVWFWAGRGSPEGTPAFARDARMTVVVLPFDAGGEADETGWLGEGLADDIMFALSRFRDI